MQYTWKKGGREGRKIVEEKKAGFWNGRLGIPQQTDCPLHKPLDQRNPEFLRVSLSSQVLPKAPRQWLTSPSHGHL